MHRLSFLAIASVRQSFFLFISVFFAQVGAVPFASPEILLELKLPGQQVIAASVHPRDFAPPGWASYGCYE
jgi:hypothetical protein